jgi:hypothetical protein
MAKTLVEVVTKEIESLRNSIKREVAVKENIFDMTMVLTHISELVEASEPLPEECPYESYEQWQKEADKELTSYRNQLENIGKNKHLVVALATFLEEHPDGIVG